MIEYRMAPCIDCQHLSEIRAAVANGRHKNVSELIGRSAISLPAAVELGVWLHTLPPGGEVHNIFRNFVERHASVRATTEILRTGAEGATELRIKSGRAEIRRVSSLGSSDRGWWEFLTRFSQTAELSGITRMYSKALAASFHEMADNVIQHAGSNGRGATPAIAAWHSCEGIAAFCVIDLGRGVRASLAENPHWAHLTDDREALVNVICKQATRKTGNLVGDGFRTVVQNFVERNGCLSLRSGAGQLSATGAIANGFVRTTPYPSFAGTRVAAWCAPKQAQPPPEMACEIIH